MSEKEEEVQPSCSSTFTGEEHLTESNVLLTTNQMQTLDDFYILNEIGEGSFSTVFLVSTKSKKMRCALKVCSKKTIQREKKVDTQPVLMIQSTLSFPAGQSNLPGA